MSDQRELDSQARVAVKKPAKLRHKQPTEWVGRRPTPSLHLARRSSQGQSFQHHRQRRERVTCPSAHPPRPERRGGERGMERGMKLDAPPSSVLVRIRW